MKKIILIMALFLAIILRTNIIAAETVYKEYKIGDKITYNDMEFYVIDDSDEKSNYVTVIKANPLTIQEVNEYGGGYLNKYTLSSKGTAYDIGRYGGVAYYSSSTCGYTVLNDVNSVVDSGCKLNYDDSDIKQIVDNWANKKLSKDDLCEDELGYEVRLITAEKLKEDFGFVKNWGSNGQLVRSESVPITSWIGWLYGGKIGYWTMSAYEDSKSRIHGISYFGEIALNNYEMYDNDKTVRPVVNFLKNSIQRESDEKNEEVINKKKLTDVEFNIGDVVEYNGIDFYVIKNSSKDDPSVTLLKAIPLKMDEMSSLIESTEIAKYVSSTEEYLIVPYITSENCTSLGVAEGTAIDCTTDYELSTLKQIVDVWSRAVLTESDLIEDYLGYKTRLLSYEDLINDLGCIRQEGTDNMYDSSDTPDWIHIENMYFTMSPYEDSDINVWTVFADNVGKNRVYMSSVVRPVVTLKKQNYDINNQTVSVPDTFLAKSIIIIVIGLLLIVMGIVVGYIVIKKKKVYKK